MRIAVVSDIHANLTALDAVIADLRTTAVDLVVHGGDLMAGGPRPAHVIDRIRELGWPGVYGNTDEMLWRPDRVSETLRAPDLHRMRDLILTHTIPATLAAIGDERLAWLRRLPLRWVQGGLTVVHAGPDDAWQVVPAGASDQELERAFASLRLATLAQGEPLRPATRAQVEPLRPATLAQGRRQPSCVVYGHIHQPFVRRLASQTIANSGAVSLSYDGDRRASYAVVDDGRVEIRRVDYDVEAEIRLLMTSGDPFAASTAETLRTGRYVPVRPGT